MSYLMRKEEGKYTLRSNPGLILPFVSLPNSHTGRCSPGHAALLAWHDGWVFLQELISTGPLVAVIITGKEDLGILPYSLIKFEGQH